MTKEELLNGLRQFTGSMKLYHHSIMDLSFNITEGVKFLCDNAGAYWLPDLLLSYKYHPKFVKEEFQVWKLERQEGNKFIIHCEDGNKRKLGEQLIPYSDMPLDTVTLWLVNGTCMLPSEY